MIRMAESFMLNAGSVAEPAGVGNGGRAFGFGVRQLAWRFAESVNNDKAEQGIDFAGAVFTISRG